MRDQAPAPLYYGLLRALHLDLQALTLTLETISAPGPRKQPETKRVGSPQRLPTRRH